MLVTAVVVQAAATVVRKQICGGSPRYSTTSAGWLSGVKSPVPVRTSCAVTVSAGWAAASTPDRSTVPSGAGPGTGTGVPSGSVTSTREAVRSTCAMSMSVSLALVYPWTWPVPPSQAKSAGRRVTAAPLCTQGLAAVAGSSENSTPASPRPIRQRVVVS